MKRKLPKAISFEGWDWGDFEESVGAFFEALSDTMTAAVAKDMAKVIDDQADQDGIDVSLMPGGNGGELPEISVDLGFLTTKGAAVDEIDSAHVEIGLPDLLDELIERDRNAARDLLPAFRAMVVKLEALQVQS